MYILGLTTMGDAAASLLKEGQLIAAAEEERFSRRKHHSGFPWMAIEYCLAEAGITFQEIEHVALYWKPWVLGHKAWQALLTARFSWEMFQARIDRGVAQISESYLGMFEYPARLRERFGPSDFKFHYMDHHECHAASCFLVSPFQSAAIFTADGTGEATTTMIANGCCDDITPRQRIKLPNSLGQFYSSVTNFLGFDMFGGDEWKVMGLAAYGKPTYYDFFRNHVVTLDGANKFRVHIDVLDHHLAKRYQFSKAAIVALGEPRKPEEEISQRHMDIAASAQKVVEDTVLHLLDWLYKETEGENCEENLCMAGGVIFNSVMNGRIMTESKFKSFYIQPAAGDAGCSLGAALLVWSRKLGKPAQFEMDHAYWGPKFTSEECATAIAAAGLKSEKLSDDILLPRVAKMIADGAIIGWFNGRMEFGPRALGARSFVADPRRANMRELLNHKVKLREWFRPLAPSILEESAEQIFGRKHSDPFMVTVLPVVQEWRSKIPAVVHVDGTARPQTVSKSTNPRYWQLIKEFEKLTGIPLLLNTSFNIQEPIVCKPEDAIKTFMGANFDALVLEDHLVVRSSQ